MNDIKAELTEKVDHLNDGQVLIYQHEEEDNKRSYLVMSAENLNDNTVKALLSNCRNLSILVSDYFIQKNAQHKSSKVSEIPLSCNLSVKGIKDLLGSLVDNKTIEGQDRILMRVVKSEDVLADTSAEARILEFMSNIDEADGVLLYGLLMDTESGVPAETVSDIPDLNTKVITTDEIVVSRFFNLFIIDFTLCF